MKSKKNGLIIIKHLIQTLPAKEVNDEFYMCIVKPALDQHFNGSEEKMDEAIYEIEEMMEKRECELEM